MNVGTLTLACVLLTVGQAPDEIVPLNQRSVRFPIDIKPERRPEIAQLTLYVSSDQGRSWNQEAVVTPDKGEFNFYAKGDGEYWLRIATVNRLGKQEPEDIRKGPPPQKILIDTQRPIVQITAAERQGNEVVVGWDIKEDHPDFSTLRLEYRTPDTPPGLWEQAAVSPGLTGQGRIRMPSPKAVKVRLQIKDTARNESVAEADVPAGAGVTTAGFTPENPVPPAPAMPASPVPAAPPETAKAGTGPTEVASLAGNVVPPAPPPVQAEPVHRPTEAPSGAAALPAPAQPAARQADSHLVASSDVLPAPAAAARPPAAAPSRELPPLQIVNSTELTMDYQLDKVGPSGVGKVELWLTEDDGKSWQRWAEDPEAAASLRGGKYQRRVELPHEGVFGFRLVVLSRAGLGEPPPKPGDPPQMRVEVDTTSPRAQLYCQPDPQQDKALLLRWECEDKNLAPNPVALEWAERREGPWHAIAPALPAAARTYSWKVTPDVPVWVFLRLRVRDTAGNEGVAVTAEPQLADLARPVGQLLSVTVTPRQQ
jgi:hypothetical protein